MKKLVFVGSVCLVYAIAGLKAAPASISATPLRVAQNNTAPIPPTQVQLLTAGAEPRQELRFKPQVNSKQTMRIAMNMDAATTFGGQVLPKFKIPASVMKMEVLVTQVDANGDIHYKFSYTDADVVADPSVSPEMVNAMQSAIKKVVGVSGTSIIDNRGQTKSGSFVLPEGSDPITKQLFNQVSNSLDQFSSPVPQEAVGVGAKWRVSDSLNVGGINLNQSVIYELVSLKDNVATLNVSLEQQANAQDVNIPGVAPKGASFSLKSLTSKGQGQMIIPLDAIMPTRSTMSINSQNEMNIKEANSSEGVTVGTQLSMQMNLESQSQ